MGALITAIIPTYKRPQWLKRAIRSVLGQSFSDFEVLVADNASGEETTAVLNEFQHQDKRLKVLRHPHNIGMTANFQAALQQTTTPYVCFLPDDDFFGPSFFEEVLPLFDQYPDIAFCGGGGLTMDQKYLVRNIGANGQVIPASGYYTPPNGFFSYIRGSFGIAFPSILFKTAIIKELGGFDKRLKIGIDEDLITKCASRHPVYLLTDRPFYFGFQHPGSLSLQADFSVYEQECLYLHENVLASPLLQHEIDVADAFFKKRRLKILSNAYKHHCARKEFTKALMYAEKSHSLTNAPQWKRRKKQTLLYKKLPFLKTLYEKVKTCEKGLRKIYKSPKEPIVECQQYIPADADHWKEYALKLEKER